MIWTLVILPLGGLLLGLPVFLVLMPSVLATLAFFLNLPATCPFSTSYAAADLTTSVLPLSVLSHQLYMPT